ncbi:hypothetical protein [Amycolatopsis eburnea]|uniref:DUF732 domain-containing protein n=1 Tax=Amycolatopsis eburnea TaxID=2267691 RepID=A0A3R9EZ07_9PSEU|nr:hypothetical protein [Amycolatopsis eburnea]RSD26334.1 hypothetical protein EIY87_00275 [Amycolatopsis eburnea]
MHRLVLTAAVAAAAAFSLTSCSPAPPDPKAEWTKSVQAAGFTLNGTHTYDEMFESAKAFCGAGSALGITGLARTALNPEQADQTAMPARGQDPDTAAKAYGDATWKWACGHQQ